ncbi:hypothetical protein [Chthonomonas calidirosea]|uniref:hypothetical protein n=1 Tax=Chthonomonas calidirosea TaxID=454171 RepID=UPI0006EC6E9F|nr:hypothetical protein [Chthonomonas calidirosea]CEK16029.1 hypothetical protein CP488_01368 [Chthonomonas calidirosea]
MKVRKWLFGAAIGVLLSYPFAAQAGISGIQYTHVSNVFNWSPASGLNGTEKVTIQHLNGSSISGFTGTYSLNVQTLSPPTSNVSGSLKNGATTLFDFSQGTLSVFQTAGSNAVFAVTVLKYSNVAPGLQNLIPNNAYGSFTGSTAGTWNGKAGQFNGQFSANTPELGSSVTMMTMLLGSGFLGLRRKR